MPEIRPFRAWRYSGDCRDLTPMVAPPYDVIGPEMETGLRERDPHNMVRLILPRDRAGSPGSRYDVAGAELESWAASGVLAQDPAPAFYPYRQTYRVAGRTEAARVGFMGLLKLEPFGDSVMAHEHTLEGPREDRFRLLQATRTNLSPVFVLFQDPGGEVRKSLAQAMAVPDAAHADRPQGERDELWSLSGAGPCDKLQQAIRAQPLVFADGHHRYESALRHLESVTASGNSPGSAGYTLAYFAPVPQPGLSILPTHRVVHSLTEDRIAGLEARLGQFFHVRDVGNPRHESEVHRWEGEALARPGRVIGLALRGAHRLMELTLKEDVAEQALAHVPGPLRELDVTVLHEVVLKPYLGIGEEELSRQTSIRYLHESMEALHELEGDAQAAFLLRPTPIESVFRVAGAGLRMPQKSTFFYPKLATGFVLHRHEA